MSRLDKIRSRWLIPVGAQLYWGDVSEGQEADVRFLFAQIDQLRDSLNEVLLLHDNGDLQNFEACHHDPDGCPACEAIARILRRARQALLPTEEDA